MWEGNPKCQTIGKDGKPSSGCNGIDAAQGCKMKFMTKEAAVYGITMYLRFYSPPISFIYYTFTKT